MDLYEHQGKELLARFGIPVSAGRVATTAAEARAAAEELGEPVVVKAQVLTGGRGKAGGVKLAEGPDEAEARAAEILGLDIRGHIVRRLWIETASDIEREYYLSVALDRGVGQALLMFTTQGGVEIEQVVAESPEALTRVHVDPLEGFEPHHVRELLETVADEGERAQIEQIVTALYRCFVESDATLCEINPLIVTPTGEVRALDAKVTIDDSALFRHPDLAELRDTAAADPLEAFARERGVIYVKLDGSVGILGNGAGLSMSTVDVVVVAGGRPANFCDLGGGGSAAGVVAALEVIAQGQPGALDPLQHLRRDNALRRGRARHPDRPRRDRPERPDRRPPRRHQRRGGPPHPGRREPRRPRARAHHARGGSPRRGARRMRHGETNSRRGKYRYE